ncbi:hypothetical protein CLJ1_1766 [Pseudomonas paraeruginosa]|nr:hypothetical protein CLJ1_1766 [Pseudomonas aeruginosa]
MFYRYQCRSFSFRNVDKMKQFIYIHSIPIIFLVTVKYLFFTQ